MHSSFPTTGRIFRIAAGPAALLTALAAGCASSTPQPAPDISGPASVIEERLDTSGGPSAPAVAPQAAAGVQATPLGKEWIFTSVAGYDGTPPPSPTDANFILSRGNGRMVGSTSCNPMSAAFEIDLTAGTLRFKNLTNGQAMCSGDQVRMEDAVTDALVATDGFVFSGNDLSLMSKGSEIAHLIVAPGVHLTEP